MMNQMKTGYCKYLRAKNPYGLLEGGENPWLLPFESNTICWCVKSSNAAGPDNDLVHPDKCVEGRTCFKAEEA
jgi:hypothetical protein